MDTKVHALRYDAARGAFEARVDVQRDGRTFRYPVRLDAAEAAPREWLESVLTRQALRMSDTPVREPAPREGLARRLSETLARIAHPFRARSAVPVRADGTPRPQARLH
jgi:hypothetical protein